MEGGFVAARMFVDHLDANYIPRAFSAQMEMHYIEEDETYIFRGGDGLHLMSGEVYETDEGFEARVKIVDEVPLLYGLFKGSVFPGKFEGHWSDSTEGLEGRLQNPKLREARLTFWEAEKDS